MNVSKFMKVIDEINFSIFMRIYNFMKFMRFMNASILQLGTLLQLRALKSFRRKNVLDSGEGVRLVANVFFLRRRRRKGRGKRAQYNEFNEHILFHCLNEYHDTWEAPGRLAWLQIV